MRPLLCLVRLGCIWIWIIGCTAASAQDTGVPLHAVEVLASYPHDNDAFTQGLAIHEGQLYESTGLHGQSSLRKVDIESGDILQRENLDEQYFGEGITVLNEHIYFLTWRSNIVFVHTLDSFELQDSFYLAGEGWGVTDNGEQLIVSDGSDTLRFLAPTTGRVERRLKVTLNGRPVRNLNELEYIEGEIWANVWYEDIILRIDPLSGIVTSMVDLRDLYPQRQSQQAVLNGIAWDKKAGRLLVTGKLWPEIHEIRLLQGEP